MTTDFYRQFEDRFRTSRENIKHRLTQYQPLFEPLKALDGPRRALDLGCGRGEWLELLVEAGFEAQGVDLDAGMLQACHERNLPATQGDALAAMRQAADNSLALVSAFHVVEHIPFDVLLALVAEAHRALRPGGLLIMETPNAENLSVGTSTFYLDPTHSKPIPHALLAFVTEHEGFTLQKVLRVNEPFEPHPDDPVLLHDLVFGASPDYAVVAIKAGHQEILNQFSALLAPDRGVAIDTIAYRYDDQIAKRFARIERELAETSHFAHGLWGHIVDIRAQHAELAHKVATLEHRLTQSQGASVSSTGLISGLARLARRPLRIAKRFYSGLREYGTRGLWLPLAQYLNASPRRRNKAMALLRRRGWTRVSTALFDEAAIRARIATHVRPKAVLSLPPTAQDIDAMVLSELFMHIEE